MRSLLGLVDTNTGSARNREPARPVMLEEKKKTNHVSCLLKPFINSARRPHAPQLVFFIRGEYLPIFP
jgi:hypothetical protein